jgi:hypothetical protein
MRDMMIKLLTMLSFLVGMSQSVFGNVVIKSEADLVALNEGVPANTAPPPTPADAESQDAAVESARGDNSKVVELVSKAQERIAGEAKKRGADVPGGYDTQSLFGGGQ